jgi:hypothetical protein
MKKTKLNIKIKISWEFIICADGMNSITLPCPHGDRTQRPGWQFDLENLSTLDLLLFSTETRLNQLYQGIEKIEIHRKQKNG